MPDSSDPVSSASSANAIDPNALPALEDALEQAKVLHRSLQDLGLKRPFENNTLQELLICKQLGLIWHGGRDEHDAFDSGGGLYELKSTDIGSGSGSKPAWGSSRDLSEAVLARYREMDAFYFAVMDGLELLVIYRLSSSEMEPLIALREQKLAANRAAGIKAENNRKFTFAEIRPRAEVVYDSGRWQEPSFGVHRDQQKLW